MTRDFPGRFAIIKISLFCFVLTCGKLNTDMRKLRTIMIFPQFERMDLIQKVRQRFDPAHDLVEPHITLCFPFKSFLSAKKIRKKIINAIDAKPFTLTASGFSAAQVSTGNFLFLNILEGREIIHKIQEQLYDKEFKKCKPHWLNETEFYPHITVGKFSDASKLLEALNSPLPSETFECVVDKIHVEIILPGNKSFIESEISLN